MLPLLGRGRAPDPQVVRARLMAIAGLDVAPDRAPAARLGDAQAEPAAGPEEPAGGQATRGAARVLAAGAVLAVLVAGWLVWRSQGGDAVPSLLTPGIAVGSASAPAPSTSTGPLGVQVLGQVRRPGVVRVPPGARVADAMAAAGGLRPGGSSGLLNLARRVVDGEQIVVAATATATAAAGAADGAGSASALVDLDTADEAALEGLPGVGPVTAAAIIAWREAHGSFGSVDQLREVDGIGPKTFEKLAPLVQVSGATG